MTTSEKWIIAIVGVSLLCQIMDRAHDVNNCADGSTYACAQAQQDDDDADTMNDEARGE